MCVAAMAAHAAVNLTMEPECVSMNGNTPVTFNNIVIRMKNAQPNTEYRLNGCSGIFNFTADETGGVNYTATNVRVYVNTDTQHAPFCSFKIEKLRNGQWVETEVAYNVPYCWVDCPNPNNLQTRYLYTASDCQITNENDFLSQKNAFLPTANFKQTYRYDWNGNGNFQGYKTMKDNQKITDLQVMIYTPTGNLVKQCQFSDYWVRSCPRFAAKTIVANENCKVTPTMLSDNFRGNAGTQYVCDGLLDFVSVSYVGTSQEYGIGTHTVDLYSATPIPVLLNKSYTCPQTFTVKARSVMCSMDARNDRTEQINTCSKEYELIPPTVSCNAKRYYSVDGGDYMEVLGDRVRESFFVRNTPYEISWKVTDGVTTAVCTTKSRISVTERPVSAVCPDYGYVESPGPYLLKYPVLSGASEVNFVPTAVQHKGSAILWEYSDDGIRAELPLGESEIRMNAYNCGLLKAELACPVLVVEKAAICD